MNQYRSSGRSGLRAPPKKRIHEYEVWTNIAPMGKADFVLPKRIHEYEVWTNIVTEGEGHFVPKKKLCT